MARWIDKPSPYPVAETMQRLETVLIERGFTVMARVDHAAHAAKAGLELRPTQVLLFGNPALGTQLMQAEQTIAIDLPSKVLAWQDAAGRVRLGYRDLRDLAAGHHDLSGSAGAGGAVAELASAIDQATDAAVGR